MAGLCAVARSRSSNWPQACGPHHVALVRADHELHRPLARVHVEVVHPEVDQDLVELPLAVDGAQHLGRLQLLHDLLRRAVHLGCGTFRMSSRRACPQLLLRGGLHLRAPGLDLLLGFRADRRSAPAARAWRSRTVCSPARRGSTARCRECAQDGADRRSTSSRPTALTLDVARPRAVAEAVQRVDDGRASSWAGGRACGRRRPRGNRHRDGSGESRRTRRAARDGAASGHMALDRWPAQRVEGYPPGPGKCQDNPRAFKAFSKGEANRHPDSAR
mgnify:CR=1 FL=1